MEILVKIVVVDGTDQETYDWLVDCVFDRMAQLQEKRGEIESVDIDYEGKK